MNFNLRLVIKMRRMDPIGSLRLVVWSILILKFNIRLFTLLWRIYFSFMNTFNVIYFLEIIFIIHAFQLKYFGCDVYPVIFLSPFSFFDNIMIGLLRLFQFLFYIFMIDNFFKSFPDDLTVDQFNILRIVYNWLLSYVVITQHECRSTVVNDCFFLDGRGVAS